MPKLDLTAIEQTNRTGYPEPFAAAMAGRHYRRLGVAGGLTDFGVSHVTLKPGGISSQRHWHAGEDEFVVLISGEAVLIEDEGETPMRAGDCAAFPKSVSERASPREPFCRRLYLRCNGQARFERLPLSRYRSRAGRGHE